MSLPYVGEECKAYYVEEASYGVTPSGVGQPAMKYIGIIEEVTPALDPRNIVIRGIGSRNVRSLRKGLRHVDLSLRYLPQDWTFFDYTRAISAGVLKSMTVEVFYEKGASIISVIHKGCKIDRMKVDVALEDPVKCSVDLIGQNLTWQASKIGVSYDPDLAANPLTGSDCVVKIDAAEITYFTDFSFEILNNLKRQPVIRSTDPHLIKSLPHRHEVLQGSLRADFESFAQPDKILTDTEFTLLFVIGTRNFTFGGCKWRSFRQPTPIEDIVAQNLEFEAKTLTIS